MRDASRSERGLSESVQYAVLFPVLMLVFLGIIQAGIWVHGRNVAARAANAAADAARGSYGDASQARDIATDLAAAGGLDGVAVSVTRNVDRVNVTVTGQAPTMVDLGLSQISETASAPLERVSTP